jgi:hypothetical protein
MGEVALIADTTCLYTGNEDGDGREAWGVGCAGLAWKCFCFDFEGRRVELIVCTQGPAYRKLEAWRGC